MSANWTFVAADGTTKTMLATETSSGIYANAVRITDATASAYQPTMDTVGHAGYVYVTNGTQTMPTMDAAARPGFVKVTNGTQTMPTMDAAARAGYVVVTDLTNTMPTMDALARPGFVRLSDGTNALMPASASLADAFANPSTTKIEALLGVFNGATWDRMRTANVFTTVALTAGTTETTIWTPSGGKKFRLLGFLLTCGAASTLTFKDNTAGSTIFVARGGTDVPISTGPMGNGVLSATADNVLTVTRGTSCTLSGVLYGCEE